MWVMEINTPVGCGPKTKVLVSNNGNKHSVGCELFSYYTNKWVLYPRDIITNVTVF